MENLVYVCCLISFVNIQRNSSKCRQHLKSFSYQSRKIKSKHLIGLEIDSKSSLKANLINCWFDKKDVSFIWNNSLCHSVNVPAQWKQRVVLFYLSSQSLDKSNCEICIITCKYYMSIFNMEGGSDYWLYPTRV